MNRHFLWLIAALIIVGALFFGLLLRLSEENDKLSAIVVDQAQNPKVIYKTIPLENSFLSEEKLINNPYQNYSEAKNDLISRQRDFIEANLSTMTITFYKSGETQKIFPILTKGKEGSWWETPTGLYSVMNMENNHLSSIGHVWMPWSIQFYGNFFIHGWPYYEDGTPVAKTYSGGCIRLSSESAKEIFTFVKKGMPILVYDKKLTVPEYNTWTSVSVNNVSAPAIYATAALIADLDTGEVLLNKNSESVLPIASLVKLMTSVVASELIYLDRSVQISSAMLSTSPIQSYPLIVGERYNAFDLLYPLLMQSSNGSAEALASFVGDTNFVSQMNAKAKTIQMNDTIFADPAGVSDGNTSSLKDLAKLAKYISDKRAFLWNVTLGNAKIVFGNGELSEIKNFNEFAGEPNLIGMKNGETRIAKQTILTVWKFKDKDNNERHILIGVLGSEDRKMDVQTLLGWFKANFGV